jgi:hypothetical protein
LVDFVPVSLTAPSQLLCFSVSHCGQRLPELTRSYVRVFLSWRCHILARFHLQFKLDLC